MSIFDNNATNGGIFGLLGGLLGGGLIASGVVADNRAKQRKIAEKVDMSVRELKNSTSTEISEGMIRAAVDQAAREAVDQIKYDISKTARSKMKSAVDSAVQQLTTEQKAAAAKAFTDRVSRELTEGDINYIRNGAKEIAKKNLVNEIKEKLSANDALVDDDLYRTSMLLNLLKR